MAVAGPVSFLLWLRRMFYIFCPKPLTLRATRFGSWTHLLSHPIISSSVNGSFSHPTGIESPILWVMAPHTEGHPIR
uniref:Uncharacterized protein n=1 Tax=Amphimedon queenslandica TaxID=400682 RepID=A0A1X7TNH3_AMPQE